MAFSCAPCGRFAAAFVRICVRSYVSLHCFSLPRCSCAAALALQTVSLTYFAHVVCGRALPCYARKGPLQHSGRALLAASRPQGAQGLWWAARASRKKKRTRFVFSRVALLLDTIETIHGNCFFEKNL